MRSRVLSLFVACAVLAPVTASAHIDLLYPLDRYDNGAQKYPPCGPPSSPDTQGTVHMFKPGATISIQVDETISHLGYFRVSFDEDGMDDFVNPASPTDYFNNPRVIADNVLPDRVRGGTHCFQVTLPDVTCANCTLQVQQIMLDKPPYEPDGNDIYYRCATVVLDPAAPDVAVDQGCEPVTPPPDGGGGGDGGCAVSDGAAPSLVTLLLIGLLVLRRRRSS